MKLYVLVRKDLPRNYQAVQAGHAVAEYLLHVPELPWDNGTLIYLGVRNEAELVSWGERLTNKGLRWFGFKEPDIGDQLTAISVLSDGSIFRGARLL